MTLKIAIIGCGMMGKNHAKLWQASGQAKIVAVFDAAAEARDAMAKDLGAVAYDTYQKAIDHEGIDAVSVCTPTPYHREITCYAAQRGRHILCEKPMAPSIEDADAMIDAAQRHGVHLTIGHQYREFARYKRIKELCDAGTLGSPLMVRLQDFREVRPKLAMHRQSMNKGPVLDMAAHWFDLMRFFTGAEPVSVYASGNVFGKDKPRLASIPQEDLAIDAADIQVRYEGGHILSMALVWALPEGFPEFGYEMFCGPKGLATKTEIVLGKDQREEMPTKGEEGPRVNDLINAIRNGTPPRVTGRDGREAIRGCLAALESIKTGKVVELATVKK